jgi:hypothetical protein
MAEGSRPFGTLQTQVTSLQSAVRSSELLMRHSSQNYWKYLLPVMTLLQAELSVASNRFDEIQELLIFIMHWEEDTDCV